MAYEEEAPEPVACAACAAGDCAACYGGDCACLAAYEEGEEM